MIQPISFLYDDYVMPLPGSRENDYSEDAIFGSFDQDLEFIPRIEKELAVTLITTVHISYT